MIDLDIIPVGDVVLEMEDMELEVNADYFNRYGIGVNLNLKQRVKYEYPLPYTEKNKISVYIVPMEYIKDAGTAAYTIAWRNSTTAQATIVLGENFQKDRTLAHEIVHAFFIYEHNNIKNNVMNLSDRALQYDIPNDFTDEQIEIIKQGVGWYGN
jgi:hypothetical protein